MDIKTKYEVGQTVYYITGENVIKSFVVCKIIVDIRKLVVSVRYHYENTNYSEDRLFAEKDEAKVVLIGKIHRM